MTPPLTISVIIPTHNGATTLARCLNAIRSSSLAPHEIIVVDDASSDNSAEIATLFHCRVIQLDHNNGAARAKNIGAQNAAGELLFFTDDDVMLANDALERGAANFNDASVDGSVGLFTPEIPFENFASQYKNHWMIYSYTRLPHDHIGVFYTSVAAIRRTLFLKLGGFDENYRGASIAEDTEFGQRVWGAGHRIVLDSRLRATHHKHYTLGQVLLTDFLRARALTLMRLRKLNQPFFTSVPVFYQLAVPAIILALVGLMASAGIGNGFWGIASFFLLLVFYILFFPWFAYLARERGARFALVAALVQPVDVLAVGAGMLIALLEYARGSRY